MANMELLPNEPRNRQLGQNHIERANRLQAVIDQLKAEHVKVQRVMVDRMTGDLWNDNRCEVCHASWPCPTAVTIGTA